MSKTITATQARNKFFDLINAAYYAGETIHITKNGQTVAQITPPLSKKFTNFPEFKSKILDKTFNSVSDQEESSARKNWSKRI